MARTPSNAADTVTPTTLLPQHQKLLDDSVISPDVTQARGYRSVTVKSELRRLGFSERQCRVPALLIPVWNAAGEIANYQIRPDQPRVNERSKVVKYETPARSRMVLDVPPLARTWIGDPGRPLFVTEGIRKADSAVSKGLCCVALLGVWNWRGSNEHGGKTALADWEHIALNGRQVYICFDSDVTTKPEVRSAMTRLKALLEQRGADVSVIYLPAGEGGSKVGLDDYLAAGHSVDDLLRLASRDLAQVPEDEPAGESGYRDTGQGLVWMKQTADGSSPVLLTSFRARIAAEVIHDDGAETTLTFEIEAVLGSKTARFTVPSARFGGLNWAIEHLGAGAVVYPGFALRDRARAAIQLLSGDVPKRQVFGHTGWREVNGIWVYLHAGGAIGEEGAVDDIEVALPGCLAGYTLPEPPSGGELAEAARASLDFLDTAPEAITVPLYAAIWTALISQADLSVHLSGPTGTGKSELAALVQQHWGAGMDARHLPGSWSSTANSLEGLAFLAKDAVLVVDDFAPTGSATDVARIHREADRLLRAQGNRSGRQRMSSDTSLRPAKPPRGLILSTGEDVPKGESLRARLVIVEVAPDSVDWGLLSGCQKQAAAGSYARALSGFLKWLAPRYREVVSTLRESREDLRNSICAGTKHKRTPDNFAKLAHGLRLFLDFATDVEAITKVQAAELWSRWLAALDEAADSQSQHQAASDPARRFVELIRAAIASGQAHVANEDGNEPKSSCTWGWRMHTFGTGDDIEEVWKPQGARIGWLVGDDLYLEPEASYAAAQKMAGADSLPVTSRTLHRRLQEKGFLVSTGVKRGVPVRRTLEGSRREVLHMRAGAIMPPETAQSAQTDQPRIPHEEDEAQDGQLPGQFTGLPDDETDQPNCPEAGCSSSVAIPMGGLGSLVSFSEEKTNGVDAQRVIAAAIEQELTRRGIPVRLGPGQTVTGAAGFAHTHARDLLSGSEALSTLARERLERLGFNVDDLLKAAGRGFVDQAA